MVRPQWPSVKVVGIWQGERCSEAGVRLLLFSELERADLTHRNGSVGWRIRAGLQPMADQRRVADDSRADWAQS